MDLRLGIDIACRTAHQASLADHTGRLLWRGHRFHTITAELVPRGVVGWAGRRAAAVFRYSTRVHREIT